MRRRRFMTLATAALVASPERSSAVTEVKHGPNPTFKAKLTGGKFMCEVVGRYTATPNLGAGGVTRYALESNDPAQRRAELLVLRTCFLEWFRETFEANGGTRREAADQVRFLAEGWLQPQR